VCRYRTVKRLGIPDSNIILMLPDDAACNARNRFPGAVYASPARELDLYGGNIEVDYRGYDVTVEAFLRLLTGRVDASVPRSKRLLTDARSNVFVYMTGHGGNEFLKFQDNEEISAFDIADAVEQMWQKKRCVRRRAFYTVLTGRQIQRAVLYDRHVPGEHDVQQAVLAERARDGVVDARRELVLGGPCALVRSSLV
jgi:glycosylphosphatidylinositol transamidase (GPIT) subunit GPI8